MFPRSSICLAIQIFLWHSSIAADSTKTIKCPNLYPENGASLPSTGMMYFSSVYNASVMKYDPKTDSCKEITIPSITNQPNTHISGIEADRSGPIIWAVVDAAAAFETSGGDLSGPAALVSINTKDNIVNKIDLKPALSQASKLNGGSEIGGTQDATTDRDGNVFVVASFGQAILKVDRKTLQPSVFFAQKKPTPKTMTYSGIELANPGTLIVWNNEFSRIETFDISSKNPQAYFPAGGKTEKSIMGDAIFIPSFSKGTCLLVSDDKANTVEVFTTRNSWKSATHAGSIDASDCGGIPTFTYELGTKIFHGTSFFTDPSPRTRTAFPQGDITNAVKRACGGA